MTDLPRALPRSLPATPTRAIGAGLLAAIALFAVAAAPAGAAPGSPRIIAPKADALVSGATVQVRIRAGGPRPRLIVGSRDVTSWLRPAKGGALVATLRRGKHLRRGMNRIVASSGRGAERRFIARTVIVGTRSAGTLKVKQRHRSRAALRLRMGSTARAEFRYVSIRLNGKRVRTRDWIPGTSTPSTRWPLGRTRFDALLGADDGLRFGRNRLVIAAWSEKGFYDRVVRTARVGRAAPLVAAHGGRRTDVGRRIVFDGSRTRPAGEKRVAYEWRVVRRPQGSRARLRGAHSARPWLRPDRNGRYRVRLVARHAGGPVATASAAAPGAVDELTVEATPAISPLGTPIQTITADGAIEVLGRKYYAEQGAWAQVLTLDRTTLEVLGNESVTMPVENLRNALDGASPEHLVVVSGGNRPATPYSDESGELSPEERFALALSQIGVIASTAVNDWRGTVERALGAGRWSAIGVPEGSESGTGNLFGMIYGTSAGAGSQPGSLGGYLRQDNHKNFKFVSAARTSINTNVPGSPAGANRIQVGERLYSAQLAAGQSGFQVVVLDSTLSPTTQRTFVTNDSQGYDETAVTELQQFITNVSTPVLGTPGYLVIMQSIGTPQGLGPEWVDDEPLVRNSYGGNWNVPVPREPRTWYAPGSVGISLAGAIGELAGSAAHDMIAQMSGAQPAPSPAAPGGFSLVASVGQLFGMGTPDPGSQPQARTQSPANSRIAGELSRDRQSLWEVDTPAFAASYEMPEAYEILYQEPTEWPLAETAGQRAANAFLARHFKLGVPDMRLAYYGKSSSNWGNLKSEIKEVEYPGVAEGFDKTTFIAVRNQLAREAGYVSNVWDLVKEWRTIFSTETAASDIDLQTMATKVGEEIEHLDLKSGTSAETEAIIGDFLWLGSSIPIDGFDSANGVIASMLDLAADSASSPDGSVLLAPVRATAANLGEELARNVGAMTSAVDSAGAIFVSDWGKLQAASVASNGPWAFSYSESAGQVEALVNSAKIEFNAALLPLVYQQYVVNPPWVSESSSRTAPWNIDCAPATARDTGHFFGSSETAPYSWLSLPATIGSGPAGSEPRWYGLTTKGTVEGEGETSEAAQNMPAKHGTKLFTQPGTSVEGLGADRIEFFADPRFERNWFWCKSSSR